MTLAKSKILCALFFLFGVVISCDKSNLPPNAPPDLTIEYLLESEHFEPRMDISRLFVISKDSCYFKTKDILYSDFETGKDTLRSIAYFQMSIPDLDTLYEEFRSNAFDQIKSMECDIHVDGFSIYNEAIILSFAEDTVWAGINEFYEICINDDWGQASFKTCVNEINKFFDKTYQRLDTFKKPEIRIRLSSEVKRLFTRLEVESPIMYMLRKNPADIMLYISNRATKFWHTGSEISIKLPPGEYEWFIKLYNRNSSKDEEVIDKIGITVVEGTYDLKIDLINNHIKYNLTQNEVTAK